MPPLKPVRNRIREIEQQAESSGFYEQDVMVPTHCSAGPLFQRYAIPTVRIGKGSRVRVYAYGLV